MHFIYAQGHGEVLGSWRRNPESEDSESSALFVNPNLYSEPTFMRRETDMFDMFDKAYDMFDSDDCHG